MSVFAGPSAGDRCAEAEVSATSRSGAFLEAVSPIFIAELDPEGREGAPSAEHGKHAKWVWCGRRGSNPHGRSRGIFLPATVFTAALRRSWSGLYLHPGFRFRCCPSSLYTFLLRGLARDCHLTGFPDFEQFYSRRFRRCTQLVFKSLVSTSFTTSACPLLPKWRGLLNQLICKVLLQASQADRLE